MRRRLLASSMAVAAGVLLMAAVASAEMPESIEGQVDFGFVVEGHALPAGSYTVERVEPTNPEAMAIRSQDGTIEEDFLTEEVNAETPPADSALVFQKEDGQYVLYQVWTAGNPIGRQLVKSGSDGMGESKTVTMHPHMKHKKY